MTTLRIGAIGLGRRWRERYEPALRTLRRQFVLGAVCDAVKERSLSEAQRLNCRAAAGPGELLDRDDIDAVLLLQAPWYGLWPLEAACRAGKPVYCAAPLEADEPHADQILGQVRARNLLVMMALLPRMAPRLARLRELLDTRLGTARVVQCDWLQTARRPSSTMLKALSPVTQLAGIAGLGLVEACAALLGGDPTAVQATESGDPFSEILLHFPGQKLARLTRSRTPFARPQVRWRILAERGTADLSGTGRLSWTDEEGQHAHVPRPTRRVEAVLLEQFYLAVTQGIPVRPNLEDAYRALGWLRAAVRSRDEARRLALE